MSVYYYLHNFESFLVILLIVELITVIGLLISIVLRRFFSASRELAETVEKKRLSALIFDYLKGNEYPLDHFISKKERVPMSILRVMEKYDQRMSSPKWEELKMLLSSQYLLPIARNLQRSSRWLKRNFSVRCFSLCPKKEDEKIILSLMTDPHFLVRSIAARAAIRLQVKEGIIKLIHLMKNETGYAYDIYRDLLIKNKSPKLFEWIEECAAQEKEEAVHLVCLDILSTETTMIKNSFLKDDLKSKNSRIYRAAVKLLAYNPQVESREILLGIMDDPDEEVRKEAAYGLRHFVMNASFEKLEKTLNDPYWRVRLMAASSLKSMGRKGREILERQTLSVGKNAYEVSQYALKFD